MNGADPARLMRFILELRQTGVTDAKALGALERTPRDHYAPAHLQALAWDDRDLPLPHGQIMTKPSMVGRMIAALDVAPGHNVLEIGAGSGFQCAALATLARKVTTLDRHADLVTDARAKLGEARVMNVAVHFRDGAEGFAEHAPYDRIIINADVLEIPAALIAQLAGDGILTAPMGGRLIRLRGGVREDLGEARFAPLESGLAAQ